MNLQHLTPSRNWAKRRELRQWENRVLHSKQMGHIISTKKSKGNRDNKESSKGGRNVGKNMQIPHLNIRILFCLLNMNVEKNKNCCMIGTNMQVVFSTEWRNNSQYFIDIHMTYNTVQNRNHISHLDMQMTCYTEKNMYILNRYRKDTHFKHNHVKRCTLRSNYRYVNEPFFR